MAGRTIEQGVSLLNAGEIRVAVLPVGPVPRDVLDEYLELINRYHHVSLSATRSFYREIPIAQQIGVSKPPLQCLDWSNSYMLLKFLQSEDARRRTRIPDLYPGRQILAILGVVYCPMCTSVQQAYDEFKKICRSYPEALVTRCFVFEPSEDHIRQERECQQLADLVMFPPGGPSHLEQHLEVWMHDLAAALLAEFEKWMLTATPSHMKLNSYADSAEFTGVSAVLDEMQKRLAAVDGEMRERQRRGRLLKAKGDMCLLSGSPRDAAEHYRGAQELAKMCSDWVWYGVALEGIAAARIQEVITATGAGSAGLEAVSAGNTGGSGGSISVAAGGGGGRGGGKYTAGRLRDGGGRGGGGGGGGTVNTGGYMTAAKWDLIRRSDAEALVRECFADARAAYKRKGGVAALQVEQHLKLARLAAGLRGAGARREVGELVAAISDLLPALPGVEDRLVATVECAQVLGLVGYCRKRTLLLWHAMEQARSVQSEKGELLRIAVQALEPPDDPQVQDPDDLPRTHWSISHQAINRSSSSSYSSSGNPSRSWEGVQTVVLEAALAAAKQAHAPAEAWEAAAALLREHYSILPPQYQGGLLETLSQASAALSTRQRTRPGVGPGPLVQLKRLLPAALPLQPAALTLTAAGNIAGGGGAGRGKGGNNAGPFIFNPYAAKRQAKQEAGEANATPEWACSDEGRVEVYIINPFAVPLKIDQLQLHVKYLGQQGAPGAAGGATAGSSHSVSQTAGGGSSAATPLTRGGTGRQPGGSTGASGIATPLAHGAAAATAATAAAAASGYKAFRTPSLNIVLAPNGRPHRVVLCGKPQLPGLYSIEGCMVTCWGVSWHVPFTVSLKRLAAGGSKGGAGTTGSGATPAAGGKAATAAAAAAAGGRAVCVNVLPPLPLVKAIIRASPCGGPLTQLQGTGPSSLQPSTPVAGATGASSAPSPGQPTPILLPPGQYQQQQGQQPQLQQQQQQQHLPQQQQPPQSQQQSGSSQSAQHHTHGADPTVVAVSPRDDDIHASLASTAFAEDLQRSPPVTVFEGQRLAWSLTLHNQGALPVTALSVMVTNHKGAALKPLRGAALPASFQGVHLEVDDMGLQAPAAAVASPASVTGTLASPVSLSAGAAAPGPGGAAALPLRPNSYITLPLALAVGQAPRGTFREVSLEVTIAYLNKPADRVASEDGAQLVGRRMTVTLTFDIQPSLSVLSTCFLDHYAPLHNGQRLKQDRPLDPRVLGGGAPPGASTGDAADGGGGAGGSGGGGADDDSDSAMDGSASRSASFIAELNLGQVSRPRMAAAAAFSRSSLGGPYLMQSLTAGPTGLQQQFGALGQLPGTGSLSSRLAGLDLSLGGSRSIRSSITSQLSTLGDRPPSLVGFDPRDGSGFPSLTPQGSLTSQQEGAANKSPRAGAGDAAPAAAVAVVRSFALGRSAVVMAEAPDDALSLVTDSVLCVTVRNTSSYFFRTWLARLDETAGPAPLTAPAAFAANCPIEVLQPGDTARLVCVLPSAAHAALAAQAAEAAATAAAATTTAATQGDSAADPTSGQSSNSRISAAAGAGAATTTTSHATLTGGSSLRRVMLTIQPPGGNAGAAVDSTDACADSVPARVSGGGGGTSSTTAGTSAVDLTEEPDRMAAAEGLAEEWAVVWELVMGLSEAAAGRAPPRGIVRLAAVDIARSMSTTAVQSLRPSTIHVQFQILPPAFPGAGTVPHLKDLTYRLRALGLLQPNISGSVWGLRAHLGEVFRIQLLVHNRGNHIHHLKFSIGASNTATATAPSALLPADLSAASPAGVYSHYPHPHQQQPYYQSHGAVQAPYSHAGAVQQVQGGPMAHAHAASFQGNVSTPYSMPSVRHQYHLHRQPHTTDGYTSGGSFVMGPSNPAAVTHGRVGTAGGATGEPYGSGASVLEPGIDSGVVLVGAVHNVHVVVEPRSTACHPLALTFVHPGLYQLYVYDVHALPQGVDLHLGGGKEPQRLYVSMDRLNVLCV